MWVYLLDRSYRPAVSFQTASLLEEVNKLKDENFLILHGTADGEASVNHPTFSVCLKVIKVCFHCLGVCNSQGTLPAQCWAPEPSSEGWSKLLTAAVPGRGPRPERATQHPALPADSGELPPNLLEAHRSPRSHRRRRGGRRLSLEIPFPSCGRMLQGCTPFYAFTLGRSSRHTSTRVGTKHIRSPPITCGKKLLYDCITCCTRLFLLCSLLKILFPDTVSSRWCWLEDNVFSHRFTKTWKHACLNGCMMWISSHCILRYVFPRFRISPVGVVLEHTKRPTNWLCSCEKVQSNSFNVIKLGDFISLPFKPVKCQHYRAAAGGSTARLINQLLNYSYGQLNFPCPPHQMSMDRNVVPIEQMTKINLSIFETLH